MSGHCGNRHTYQPHAVASLRQRGLWTAHVRSHKWFSEVYPGGGPLIIRIYDPKTKVYEDITESALADASA